MDTEKSTSWGTGIEQQGIGFLMFNCQKEPFNDKRVRQAFHYAIDYDKLIKNQEWVSR